jgi:hypothetical protein
MKSHMKLLLDLTTHKPETDFGLIRDDFNKRYAESYMQISTKQNPTEIISYIEGLASNGTLKLYNHDDTRGVVNLEDVLSLKSWLPKSGYYQLPTRTLYIERRAARQWKRSFSFSMYNTGLEHRDIPILYKTWKTPPPLFSLNDIDEDSPDIKLTNQLATLWSKQHGLCIAFEGQIIAKLQPLSKRITLLFSDFEQEIRDYLRNNNLLNWKISK